MVCEGNLEQEITRGTVELLSAGDELASKLGGSLVAVGFPAAMRRHAALLAGYGADRILLLDHPALASRRPECRRSGSGATGDGATALGIVAVRERIRPRLGSRLAARLGWD